MSEQSQTFNILSWNMFLDKTRVKEKTVRSQLNRLPVFIETLRAFPGALDVVTLQEVSLEKNVHCGETLAKALGFSASYFFTHNSPAYEGSPRGRKGEHLGMFGQLVTGAEVYDIGDSRRAVKTNIGSTAIINTHLRQGICNGGLRLQQAGQLLDIVADDDQAVLAIDTNELRFSSARRLLQSEGFRPVSRLAGTGRSPTYPTPEYRKTVYGSGLKGKVFPGIGLDEIYVRNLEVLGAGRIAEAPVSLAPVYDMDGTMLELPNGASDHYGLWAQLRS